MYDQYNQQREGYCFLDEPENGLTGLQLDTRLVRHLMNSRSGREQFFDDAGWNHRQLRQWFESTAALMDSILICMHLTYGQPARASELCALLCRNHKDASRNLFWSPKTMLLAGPYNKTRSVTQKNKYIARFFPSRLATVVKIYLALVRPMEMVTSAQPLVFSRSKFIVTTCSYAVVVCTLEPVFRTCCKGCPTK
jgi:hypothetical protein